MMKQMEEKSNMNITIVRKKIATLILTMIMIYPLVTVMLCNLTGNFFLDKIETHSIKLYCIP